MTEQTKKQVKRTVDGYRIYELTKTDDANRYDLSGLHINYGYTPYRPTFKEKLVSFFTLGLR